MINIIVSGIAKGRSWMIYRILQEGLTAWLPEGLAGKRLAQRPWGEILGSWEILIGASRAESREYYLQPSLFLQSLLTSSLLHHQTSRLSFSHYLLSLALFTGPLLPLRPPPPLLFTRSSLSGCDAELGFYPRWYILLIDRSSLYSTFFFFSLFFFSWPGCPLID